MDFKATLKYDLGAAFFVVYANQVIYKVSTHLIRNFSFGAISENQLI